MSGGKGGGSTTSVEIPEYIEKAAQRNLNKAEGISQIGYTPYYGPDVAAFTPSQQAAFQNTADSAGAFGMAAPTSQRDIMGGMGAPTTYANGVQGYSSAPMFEQSLDQLEANRPGQKNYIDSFFIDPFTGQAGSRVSSPVNYEDYTTSAESGRNEAEANRSNELAIAQAQAGAGPESYYNYSNIDYSPTSSATSHITNPADGITDTSPASTLGGIGSDLSEAVVSNTIGLFNPTYRTGMINNPIANPSVSEMVQAAPTEMDYNPSTGGYVARPSSGTVSSSPRPPTKGEMETNGGFTGLKDMFDGGGAGGSGDTYKDAAGNDKILCCAYYNLGYLPRDIWRLDQRYGVWLHRNDPELMSGYLAWATPLAEYVQKDTFMAKTVRAVMRPIVVCWAKEMAHNMKPEKYKPNYVGKLIKFIGEPFSRMCGKLKSRKIEEMA